MTKRRLITFDWALKRLLRSKSNFNILEGFLSELLYDKITVMEILESESNQETDDDKFNRVDLKAKNQRGEVILIEVQYAREYDYFHRILYGACKSIVEHLKRANAYEHVVKVISISILYFDLGQGKDYIYHGTTSFRGIHQHDVLQLSRTQKKKFSKREVTEIYPEYYLLKINQFDDIAKDTLDEWIYFLKNEEIKDEFEAQGLQQARKTLDVMHMPEQERAAYEIYLEDARYQASIFNSYYGDGIEEGRKEGREEGRKEGRKEGVRDVAIQLLDLLDDATIADRTGLPLASVQQLRAEYTA
jgi:predicted transposase/invertase (TIGR01784 family)